MEKKSILIQVFFLVFAGTGCSSSEESAVLRSDAVTGQQAGYAIGRGYRAEGVSFVSTVANCVIEGQGGVGISLKDAPGTPTVTLPSNDQSLTLLPIERALPAHRNAVAMHSAGNQANGLALSEGSGHENLEMIVVRNSSDVQRVLSLSGNAEANNAFITGTLAASLRSELSRTNENVYVVIKSLYWAGEHEYFRNPQLSSSASEALSNNTFRDRCGDRWMHTRVLGGMYFGIITLQNSSVTSNNTIDVAVTAVNRAFGQFGATASFSQAVTENFSNFSVSVQRSGGIPGSGGADLDSMLNEIRQYRESVPTNPVPMIGYLENYNAFAVDAASVTSTTGSATDPALPSNSSENFQIEAESNQLRLLNYADASTTCSLRGMRLPSYSEIAGTSGVPGLATTIAPLLTRFSNWGASSRSIWTTDFINADTNPQKDRRVFFIQNFLEGQDPSWRASGQNLEVTVCVR